MKMFIATHVSVKLPTLVGASLLGTSAQKEGETRRIHGVPRFTEDSGGELTQAFSSGELFFQILVRFLMPLGSFESLHSFIAQLCIEPLHMSSTALGATAGIREE